MYIYMSIYALRLSIDSHILWLLVDFQLPFGKYWTNCQLHTLFQHDLFGNWISFAAALAIRFFFDLTFPYSAIIKWFLICAWFFFFYNIYTRVVCLLMSATQQQVIHVSSQPANQSLSHPSIHPVKQTRQSSNQRAVINTCCAFKWQK